MGQLDFETGTYTVRRVFVPAFRIRAYSHGSITCPAGHLGRLFCKVPRLGSVLLLSIVGNDCRTVLTFANVTSFDAFIQVRIDYV